MNIISIEEVIEYKILPFDLFSEFGEKIFSAGEALTPGKLLQLKHFDAIYRGDDLDKVNTDEKEEIITSLESTLDISIKKDISIKDKEEKQNEVVKIQQPIIVEEFDMNPSTIKRNKLSVDDIDIENYKGPVNRVSRIDPQTQLKIKAFYQKTLDMVEDKSPAEVLGMFANIRDKIVQDVIYNPSEVLMSSQLKLLGEYNRCHALNTSILSGMVAKNMELSEAMVYDIVLAGLLHDIGKSKLPERLRTKINLSSFEQKEVEKHTNLGYRLMRAEMELPDNIARVALDHHEFNDGSGYPSGHSGDKISVETQIVAVCNYFDNLTSNRTIHQIKNTKDALRVILQMGTKKFSAKALYTFVHMFSYNDTTNFEEMIL